MKFQKILSLWLCLCLIVSLFVGVSATVSAASDIITTPTGYTEASDVVYKTTNGYIANWGARGEDCVFLSKYATQYYTGSYTFETLSQKSGGSTQSNASSSELYKALQNMMKSKHDYETSYKGTRDLYCYTDCLRNDIAHISSFYSGKQLNGAWDNGKTWNREHTWPNSKGLSGNDENDIMMLRPTSVSENSDRGNIAYGESSKYYDPGVAVRGDCARIVLYVYTRWGNTQYMWGEGGVMESMSVLLKWMEEDPVDTWEMGRNDAVESITGVRNVFVDYPEYAWLLFGKSVPADVTTPSGGSETEDCTHKTTEIRNAKDATCTEAGYSGDTHCANCGELLKKGSTVTALGHNYANGICTRCGIAEPCAHKTTEIRNAKEATCTENGYTGDIYCANCGTKVYSGVTIKALGHDYEDGACTRCGEKDPDATEKPDDPKPPVDDPKPPVDDPKPKNPFEDVEEGDYFAAPVLWAVEKGITNGTSASTFSPNAPCTRGQIVTFLWRACGSPEPTKAENPFTDVKAGEYYYKAVLWAVEEGITTGLSDTTFGPDATCTRGQVATFLWRSQGKPVSASSNNPFSDVVSTDYYYEAVLWAVENGVTQGMGPDTFAPNDSCTRGQIVTFLYRALVK